MNYLCARYSILVAYKVPSYTIYIQYTVYSIQYLNIYSTYKYEFTILYVSIVAVLKMWLWFLLCTCVTMYIILIITRGGGDSPEA